MSKRGQVDLASDDKADSPFPVRRSSRIQSGQNVTTVTSSPAPKAIKSRRSSANSLAEKNVVEENTSPKDKRKTRRASTDEDIKPSAIRSRRSSVSKVIEEERTSTPNSPSRRSGRLATASPLLEVPARRTRRSSQETETVEVPAKRTTRRSSTGIQESTVEEIIEKAKPVTRRRRSSSIDEPEENAKIENTRSKTKRLFSEDNHLEPIVEQEQEVKEKEVFEEKQESGQKLEVLQETADEETEKLIEDLKEALGEEFSTEMNISGSEKPIAETKKNISQLSGSEDLPNQSFKEVDAKLSNDEKEQSVINKPVIEKEKSLLEKKNCVEIKVQIEQEDNKKIFSSPGSDKENTSINMMKKRLSTKINEGNSIRAVSEQNVFAVQTTKRNSFYEPMDVDEDEEDLFGAQGPSESHSPKRLTMNGKPVEKETKVSSMNGESCEEDEVKVPSKIQTPKRSSMGGKLSGEDEVTLPFEIITTKRSSMGGKPGEDDVTASPMIQTPKRSSMGEKPNEETKVEITAPSRIQTPKRSSIGGKPSEEDVETEDEGSLPFEIKTPKRSSMGGKPNEVNEETKDEVTAPSKIETPKRSSIGGKPSGEDGETENEVTAPSKIQTPKVSSIGENPSGEDGETKDEVTAPSKIQTPKRSSIGEKPSGEDGETKDEVTAPSKIQTPKRSSIGEKPSGEDGETKDEVTAPSKIQTPKRSSMGGKPSEDDVETEDEGTPPLKLETPKRSSMGGKTNEEKEETKDEVTAPSKIPTPKKSSMGGKLTPASGNETMKRASTSRNYNEENGHSEEMEIQNVSMKEPEISKDNVSVKSGNNTMEGSFSQLNSSPDQESPLVHKSFSATPSRKSLSLRENKLPSLDDIDETRIDDDCASDTSIKLVDTDEEEEIAVKKNVVEIMHSHSETDQVSAINVSISESVESVFDKSFDSEEHSLIEKTGSEIVTAESSDEKEKDSSQHVDSGEEIDIEVVDSDETTVLNISPTIDDKTQMANIANAAEFDEKSAKGPNKDVSVVIVDITNEDSRDVEIVQNSPESKGADARTSIDKSEGTKNDKPIEMIEFVLDSDGSSGNNESMMETNDSKAHLSFVKSEKESVESETDSLQTKKSKNCIKTETEENSDFICVDEKYPNETTKTDETEEQKTKMSPIKKIILQSIKVIQPSDEECDINLLEVNTAQEHDKTDNRSSEDQKQTPKIDKSRLRNKRTRHSLPSGQNQNDSDDEQEEKVENSNTRFSLPNRRNPQRSLKSTKNISENDEEQSKVETNKTKLRKSNTRLSSSKNITEITCKDEVNLISSSDDEDNTSLRIEEGTNKRKYEENRNAETTNIKDPEVDDTPKKSSENRKKLVEIMNRSGIEVEDQELQESSDDDDESNEFLDDMAVEGEETLSNEESDENEIKVAGESVLSSDEGENSSVDDYDLDDSFIDDEEIDLLSGEEDFLGTIEKKKSKKYKKIIQPSDSDSDEVKETSSKPPKIPEVKLVSVEEIGNTEEPIQNTEIEKSFEEKLDSILKINPVEISTPNQSLSEVMNSSKISESSVILQETCSVGAAKSKIILNRINGMVDVFCKSINESEGNISLNVSLNYIPPTTSTRNSMEARNSLNVSLDKTTETKDQPPKNSQNSSRLSCNEISRVSISPRKSTEVRHVDQSPKNSHNSSRLSSSEIISRKSISPRKFTEKNEVQSADKRSEEGAVTNEAALLVDNGNDDTEVVGKIKRSRKKKPKKKQDSSPKSEESGVNEQIKKTLKRPADTTQDMKSSIDRENAESNSHFERKKKKNEHHEANISYNSEKDIPEPKLGKKKNKNYESVESKRVLPNESSSVEMKKTVKTDWQVEEVIQDKKGKRKPELSEEETVNKKLRTSKTTKHDKKQTKTSNMKEIKPTKYSSSSIKQSEWDEEEMFVRPSAATTSKSGFNLEKLIDNRDFKNRMIYDSSRNKREPYSKSRRHF